MAVTIDGSGTITGASTLATTVASPTLTTPNINSAQFATVVGTAPIFPCRAWVNFNGTGTVAIRASGNVSSITDNSTGDYTVNFTSAMPDANYTAVGSSDRTTGSRQCVVLIGNGVGAMTTTSVGVNTLNDGTTLADAAYVGVAIFR